MKLTLTTDIQNGLINEANKQGTTPEMLALDCLRKRFVPSQIVEPLEEEKRSLADFLSGHIGVLASGEHIPGGAHLSENCGQKFTAELVKKRQRRALIPYYHDTWSKS